MAPCPNLWFSFYNVFLMTGDYGNCMIVITVQVLATESLCKICIKCLILYHLYKEYWWLPE